MSQQFQQQPTAQQTQYQQSGQGFQQSVPTEVSQAVMTIEQFETDAEWAKTRALRTGDYYAVQELEDLVELLHLQKKFLVRQSWHAPTVGQCVQEAIQHGSQELQQSQVPEVQQIAQQSQQLIQTIQQASMQTGQPSQQGMGGQSQIGQSGFGGQQQSGGQQWM